MLFNQNYLLTQVRRLLRKPTLENWWSHFQRLFSGWAIDHFKELVYDTAFIPDNIFHMENKCLL